MNTPKHKGLIPKRILKKIALYQFVIISSRDLTDITTSFLQEEGIAYNQHDLNLLMEYLYEIEQEMIRKSSGWEVVRGTDNKPDKWVGRWTHREDFE